MDKAVLSTMEEMPRIQITTENRDVKDEKEFGWSKDPYKNASVDDRTRVSSEYVKQLTSIKHISHHFRLRTQDQCVNGTSARRTRKTSTVRTGTETDASDHRNVRTAVRRTRRRTSDQKSIEA